MFWQGGTVITNISNICRVQWFIAFIYGVSFCSIPLKPHDRKFCIHRAGMNSCYFYFMRQQINPLSLADGIHCRFRSTIHIAIHINFFGGSRTDINNPEPPTTWMTKPTIKTALAGGYCLRAPAQQACNYANICEHCPSFHTTIQDIPVLTRQRDIAATLANDAQHRGWDTETERHLKLITRLNNLIDNTTTRPNAE